jgi:KDO2-lipid IV(A) lauroyltransferase
METSQQQQLIKKSLIETGKTLIEAGPMWLWNKNKLFNLVKKVHGEKILEDALHNKKSVILALPHLGNWELLSLYCSAKYSTTTMYQEPKMAQLDSIVKKGRERFGANLVPADNQGVRAMLKALKKNEFVCILPDQEPSSGNGIFSPFFGIQAYSMTLISRLAKKTDAIVVMAYAKRLNHGLGYEIVFTALDKINEGSQEDSVTYLNAEIEKCIRQLPEQYQWSYKRFRQQPAIKDKRITGKDFYNP